MARRKHVFGPVHSRRLGLSLGVDLVPYKTCSLDCIYCQLGPTTDLRIQRGSWVSADTVLRELEAVLSTGDRPDYITLSGSGEPTLSTEAGRIIRSVRKVTDVPVAVLTNASLLWDRRVQDALSSADLVVPSLDAPNPELFRRINRPHPELDFEQVVGGLHDFSRHFSGALWLEVFLVPGVNDSDAAMAELRATIQSMRVDRVQLNTAMRPTAVESVGPVSPERLVACAQLLGPHVEIVTTAPKRTKSTLGQGIEQRRGLELLRRRPCTLSDLCAGLQIGETEAQQIVEELLARNLVSTTTRGGTVYYVYRQPP